LALLQFRTTLSFRFPIDTIRHQIVGLSRVSRVRRIRTGIKIRVMIRIRFSFSGANLNRKTLGDELLPGSPDKSSRQTCGKTTLNSKGVVRQQRMLDL